MFVVSRKQTAAKPWHDDDVARTLNIANGLLSHLRDMPPEQRPDATTEGYLMRHYRCSKQRLRDRIADAEDRKRRRRPGHDLAAEWLETLRLIADELGEKLYAHTHKIAYDPGNRNAFNAQKFLIDKNERLFAATDATPGSGSGPEQFGLVSDIEQEVFDELTDAEEAQLAELIEAETQIKIKLSHIVRRVRKRLADRRVSDIDVETTDDVID